MEILRLVFFVVLAGASSGVSLPQGPDFNKLRCKIVQDGTQNCNDVIGRSCDDSPYLEVRRTPFNNF
jgi:hypothetical protein